MTVRSILAHVIDAAASAHVLAAAGTLAHAFDATVHGLHIREPLVMPMAGLGDVPSSVIDAWQSAIERRVVEAKTAFATQGLKGSCSVVDGDPVAAIARASRAVDLTIIAQANPEADAALAREGIADELVFRIASPLLSIPYIGLQATLGSTVAVAWNDTREAFRAVRESIPLLTKADSVTVISIDTGDAPIGGVPELLEYLKGHGVPAVAKRVVADNSGIGDTLLSTIADLGSDLVVMGAYGHSRLREFVLGGATRDLLRHMTVPVLMAH
ncbi:MAG: universal stress protein [Alphaproteobacteria bacterium]|nr:universal stress protein [Alphaproteobacteria bacterium]